MTIKQAAEALGVTPHTLRQQIANGKLRATKRGRDWWVTKGEVARYAQRHLRDEANARGVLVADMLAKIPKSER